ncbi:MAG: Dipeptide transport system permease protein DppB [Planctomycetes bacterium]|nr:Dipeptide transport system permease protein DppB [Planctomycetota bacterium]
MVVFVVGELLPGDPAVDRFGEKGSPAAIAEWRARKGLDLPVHERYLRYVGGVVTRLDFGESYKDDYPVSSDLRDRFAATAELAFAALLLAVPAGIAAGTASAALRGRAADAAAQGTALLGVSIPVFWLGMILVLAARSVGWNHFQARFDVRAHDDAVAGFTTPFVLFESVLRGRFAVAASCAQHILVPALALATIPLATVMRMTRSAVLDEIGKDYVRTAEAKGVPRARAVVRHALRNALMPVVTVIGLQAGTLLSGAALTETVFTWPGLGTYIVSAVQKKDSPALVGGLLLVAATFVIVNLVVDLLYGVLDPRLRRSAS